MTRRAGHSLPELIVAVTFLGAAMGGVAASTLLGARWASEALLRQEALRVAGSTLDSLSAVPAPVSGARASSRWRLRWTVSSGEGRLRVTVEAVDGRRLARLEGRRVPAVPVLPDPPAPDGE